MKDETFNDVMTKFAVDFECFYMYCVITWVYKINECTVASLLYGRSH